MNINRIIWQWRPLCVAQELTRYVYHKTFGCFYKQKTPVWYSFDRPCKVHKKETLPINADWYKINRLLYRSEHVFYNINNAVKVNPDLKGIALIFFMGIGDYLYTTPMIEALKKKFPNLPFYAYVSQHFDRNNSPIVGSMLMTNPNIEKVFYFDGYRNPLVWKNYNYDDAFKSIPQDFLAVPVYYQYGTKIKHRTISLFKTFSLPFGLKKPAPAPIFYFPQEAAPAVTATLQKILPFAKKKKGIVFLQLDSRGSSYTYPYTDDLIRRLIREDYFVASVTPSAVVDEAFCQIDVKQFTFNQTCHLLSLLKQKHKMYIIAVNSVFWAASAGLDIPNLGLQHWIDKKVHNLWYPNITVVTDYIYKNLPEGKMLSANPQDYTRHNKKIINYKADFVLECFKKITG